MFRNHTTTPKGCTMRIRQIRRTAAAAAATIVATTLFAGAGTALGAVATGPNRYRVEITNVRSGLKADVMWASQTPGQPLFLWPDNTSASQEFDLIATGDGWFNIRARHSGQCVWPNYAGNGGRVMQDPQCGPSTWNTPGFNDWRAISMGAEGVILVNRSSGRCLDADNGAGGAPPAWARLQVWDCIRSAYDWNAGNQLWRINNVY